MNTELSPRHLQLRHMLFKRWKSSGLKPGAKIESQNEIIKFCGFSLITVIKTLKDLEAEGIIRRQVGKGSFLVQTPWVEAHWRIGFFYNRNIVGGGIFNNEFYTKLVVAFEKGVITDGHEFILGSFTNSSMPISMWDALDGVVLTGITEETQLDSLSETSSQISLIVDMMPDILPLHGFRLGYRQSFGAMFQHYAKTRKKFLYLDTSIVSPEQNARRDAFFDAHGAFAPDNPMTSISVNQETERENTAALEDAIIEFQPDIICGYWHRSWHDLVERLSTREVKIYGFSLDSDLPGFVVNTTDWMRQVLPKIYNNLENRQSAPAQHTFQASFNP